MNYELVENSFRKSNFNLFFRIKKTAERNNLQLFFLFDNIVSYSTKIFLVKVAPLL